MRNYNYLLFALLFLSCGEVIVENIEDDFVTIISPANNSVDSDGLISFSWQELDNADSYRLQIVTPSFGNATGFVLDSLISNRTSFEINLDSGNYEWQIRGENFGTESQYTQRTFLVQ